MIPGGKTTGWMWDMDSGQRMITVLTVKKRNCPMMTARITIGGISDG